MFENISSTSFVRRKWCRRSEYSFTITHKFSIACHSFLNLLALNFQSKKNNACGKVHDQIWEIAKFQHGYAVAQMFENISSTSFVRNKWCRSSEYSCTITHKLSIACHSFWTYCTFKAKKCTWKSSWSKLRCCKISSWICCRPFFEYKQEQKGLDILPGLYELAEKSSCMGASWSYGALHSNLINQLSLCSGTISYQKLTIWVNWEKKRRWLR